ncbi:acetyltransferase [Antarcticibacterium flavum]|uniref:Acetyltransferase n=1 Tax=Antarcticibacterium flavum TaxID=2058175 RepID=A0A5B7X1R5_9FLAO|nr:MULTISPECIES: acetyltransferase [Antarcticibacterium]MCM4158757.1 acetyltransferase [Antarcticibacterium sp. W02-3]QCY68608.1 acetyltransferase [Antarcticibacterium flavum]
MNLYGASGHAKVIIDIIRSLSLEVDHIIDDDPQVKNFNNLEVTHKLTENISNGETIISIGNNEIRKKISEKFAGAIHPAIAHPSAVISPSAKLMQGTVVMANAAVNAAAVIGEHCIINTGATVEHDCKLGNFVHISPNAALAGDVEVGEGSHIGIGAVVIQGIKIGKWVTVGAGAVVINDIPDGVVAVGNPAQVIKEKTK